MSFINDSARIPSLRFLAPYASQPVFEYLQSHVVTCSALRNTHDPNPKRCHRLGCCFAKVTFEKFVGTIRIHYTNSFCVND